MKYSDLNLVIRLNSVRYQIEKESVDVSKKIDIMSYQAFAKLVEASGLSHLNRTLNLSSISPHGDFNASPEHFNSLSGQISPIAHNIGLEKKEVSFKDSISNKPQIQEPKVRHIQ